MSRKGDIEAVEFPASPSWAPADRVKSLRAVYEHVSTHAHRAIGWYAKAKTPKRWGAVIIRALAIAVTSFAGIVPLLGDLIKPIWASIALTVVVGLLAFDRFFGYSSGWIRFVAADLKLHAALNDFEFEWEVRRARWQAEPSDEDVAGALGHAKAFAATINAIVQEETNLWIQEFQRSLEQITERVEGERKVLAERVEARRKELEPGAVNITVSNGDQCPEWEVSLDDGAPRKAKGKSTAMTGLTPGLHTVVVSGKLTGKRRSAERAFEVTPGGTSTVDLTLV